MLTDETCWFLAADFDKVTWQEDVRAFLPPNGFHPWSPAIDGSDELIPLPREAELLWSATT